MSGFLGIISNKDIEEERLDYITETINLSRNFILNKQKVANNIYLSASYSNSSPVNGKRLFENDKWEILFSGDLVEYSSVPFKIIIDILEKKEFESFKKFDGIFSIAALDKESDKLFIISDRRGQHPVYHFSDHEGIYFSTELSTFCRFEKNLSFNKKWLWEYLFFNYPVSNITFLENVNRVPPASVIEYNLSSRKHNINKYDDIFKRKEELLDGGEALELATEIFEKRIPKYFDSTEEKACALTGGWDGRTLLGLSQDLDNTTVYTYGVPGCKDLREAKKTAKKLNIDHETIHFDDEFIQKLPKYMLETVFLSSGLERVNRSTLLYVYRNLTKLGTNFPLVISGISFDMQFRGHANPPALISKDMAQIFKSGNYNIKKERWSSIVKTNFSSFKEHILSNLQSLQNKFGDFESTNHHLSFILYILSPKYFDGEVKIANNFTTIRVPAWDSNIIDLSYKIKFSTLSYSEFYSSRGGREEVILQSHLLKNFSPKLAKIPIGCRRPDMVLKGKIFDLLYWVYRGGIRKLSDQIFRKEYPPLENQDEWFNNIHKDFIDNLIFSENSLIRKYITDEYLQKIKDNRNTIWIGKLVSVEIILRLIENDWERFW